MGDTGRADYPPRRKAWLSAAIIFLLTTIALADRMAISMLIGPIKAEFGIGDFQASLLIGLAFTAFYALFLMPIGALADRFSRPLVFGVCLFCWSIATVACGFAGGFVSLFLLRMAVGSGEAGMAPCSHGIIGASFPREQLSKPLALQGIGFQVGPAVGVAAAGAILAAGKAGSFAGLPVLGDLAPWRIAFILIGLPGLAALLLVPLLHDPPRRRVSASSEAHRLLPFLKQNKRLMVFMLCGSGVSSMALGTVTGWVPEYLQRSLGVSPLAAGSTLGAIMLACAFLGQGIYAAIVDWMAARGFRDAPIRVGLFPIACSVPLAWIAFEARTAAGFYPLLIAFLLCVTPFNALNNTVAQQIAPAALRSRISALFIFAVSVLGFSIGPALVGLLSQFVFGEAHLGTAMQLVTTCAMAGTFILIFAARRPLLVRMETVEAEG